MTAEGRETTVLVVDDSDTTRSGLRRALEQSDLRLSVLEAKDGAEALQIVLSSDVHIIISDIIMPRLDGIQLLRSIRQQRELEALPVILVTSQDDEERRLLSFETGANDYLCKPFSAVELLSRVRVQMRLRQLQVDLRRANDRFRELSLHDELTGLCNRRAFLDAASRELARSRRHGYPLAFVFADIDGFRAINQRVGDLVGDAIIADVGTLVSGILRASDVVARLSGAKFGVMLGRADADYTQGVVRRIQEAVATHPFPSHGAGEISMSFGVCLYPNGDMETLEELVNATEAALERARGSGGGQVETYAVA